MVNGADLLAWVGIAGLLWLARREKPDPEETAAALIEAAKKGERDALELIELAEAVVCKQGEKERGDNVSEKPVTVGGVEFRISTDHSASSYGQPVVVCPDGEALGAGDFYETAEGLVSGAEIMRRGEAT